MTPRPLLLVDDAPDMGLIVRRLGRQAGYEAQVCPDAGAAWDYLKTVPAAPSLVLLDLHLPGASGPELCARLREDVALAALPVALFTVSGGGDAVASGLDAGADFLMWKDLLTQPGAWARRLHEVLAAARQPPALMSWADVPVPVCPAAEDVIQRLNRGLRQPPVRQAGAPVLEVLALRALVWARWWQTGRGAGAPPPRLAPGLRAKDAEGCLEPGSLALRPGLADRLAPPGTSLVFSVALAEQLHRVLGPAAAAPLRAQLAAVAPALANMLAS